MDASKHEVMAYMSFPHQHRTKLHSKNPIERLNKEVKRRADVVGFFRNEASIMRLGDAVLFEQNDEWQTSSRYMMIEGLRSDRHREDRPHSQHNHESRLITPSSRQRNYNCLTDLTFRIIAGLNKVFRFLQSDLSSNTFPEKPNCLLMRLPRHYRG